MSLKSEVEQLHQRYQDGLLTLGGLIQELSTLDGFPVLSRWAPEDVQDVIQRNRRDWPYLVSRYEAETWLANNRNLLLNRLSEEGYQVIEDALEYRYEDFRKSIKGGIAL